MSQQVGRRFAGGEDSGGGERRANKIVGFVGERDGLNPNSEVGFGKPRIDTDQPNTTTAAIEGAPPLECGDLSPLLRRRLVAVELPSASGHAGAPALARAVNAPSLAHAPHRPTATSRLRKSGGKSPHSKFSDPPVAALLRWVHPWFNFGIRAEVDGAGRGNGNKKGSREETLGETAEEPGGYLNAFCSTVVVRAEGVVRMTRS